MTARIVIVQREPPKLGRKWLRAAIGIAATIAVLLVESILPRGLYGFLLTVAGAATFVVLFDAIYTSLRAASGSRYVDDTDPLDFDGLDRRDERDLR